ncbi:MAG TPA: ATP-binding protein [Tepidisphaeraceae bacterium]
MTTDDRSAEHFHSSAREPRIVLLWLIRLRWLAVIGQFSATGVASLLGLSVPLTPLFVVVAITAASNLLLAEWRRRGAVPSWLIPAILLLDMTLLTVLLLYTGGPANPFGTLYLIHVAMAVTTLGVAWTWVVVLAAAVGYALLFVIQPVPLVQGGLPPTVERVGLWINLVLISVLITYFVGRLNRSLREREVEINALQERASRHEKLATLSTLAAGAAHELGTPLATIAVVAKELELAIKQLPDSAELVEDAQLIRQECNRCRFILDRMRVEVASDPGSTPTPLSTLMKRLSEHLREDENARLSLHGTEGDDAIAVPCPALEQSLTVMIRNAIDASSPDTPVELHVRRSGKTIAFEVIDQGHGMPPDVLKRAGDPFFTTKEPGRGMGLGLFLVRLVAENYRGKFVLDSKPGEGTKSTLELPLA